MVLYYQGSGILVIQMNRIRTLPPKGAGLAQGGRSNKQEISRWDVTIPYFFISILFKSDASNYSMHPADEYLRHRKGLSCANRYLNQKNLAHSACEKSWIGSSCVERTIFHLSDMNWNWFMPVSLKPVIYRFIRWKERVISVTPVYVLPAYRSSSLFFRFE